jgi:hypothetical protein
MSTIYTYTTAKGNNVETFERGWVTLTRDGKHVYEYHFGSLAFNLQEQMLVSKLEENGINYSVETK